MKTITHYDLIEEVTIANKGFSLKRYAKTVLKATAIGTTILLPMQTIDGITIRETVETVVKSLEVYAGIYGMYSVFSRSAEQSMAEENLIFLSLKLDKNSVDTSSHMLMNSKVSKIQYRLNFSSFPPELEQRKHIRIPIFSTCDNKELTLLQDHVIGTRNYYLSSREVEKVYTYKMPQAIK